MLQARPRRDADSLADGSKARPLLGMAWQILVFAWAAAIVQSIYYYPRLPELMTTTFNFSGLASGQLAKWLVFVIYAVALSVVTDVAILVYVLRRRLLPKANESTARNLSLPGAGGHYVIHAIIRIEVATAVFLLVVMQLVFLANMHPPARLSPLFIAGLIVYALYVAAQLVVLARGERRKV